MHHQENQGAAAEPVAQPNAPEVRTAEAVPNADSIPSASSHGQPTAGLSAPYGELEVHDIANLFPPMREREFEALVADIQEHGQFEAIWTHQGKIIDGRNRFRACKQLGMTPRTQEWDGEGSLLEFVIALNLHRRHLKETQRAMIAARMMPKFEEEAKKRQEHVETAGGLRNFSYEGQNDTVKKSHEGRAADDVGKLLNVSWMSVVRARKVLDKGSPALIDAVDHCKVAVTTAATLAEFSHKEQEDLLKLGRKALAEALHPKPACSDQPGAKVEAAGAAGPAKMPQAPPAVPAPQPKTPPPDVPSAQHSPIFEQRVADDWLLQHFRAGNATLTKDAWGFRLEFSDKPIEDWRAALNDEFQLFRMIERGFRIVWKRKA